MLNRFNQETSAVSSFLVGTSMAGIIAVILGMADLGVTWLTKERLDAAVWAAAGAVASQAYRDVDGISEPYCNESDASWTRLTSVGEQVVGENFPSGSFGSEATPSVTVSCNDTDGKVTVEAEVGIGLLGTSVANGPKIVTIRAMGAAYYRDAI